MNVVEGQSQVPGFQCSALQTPTWAGPFLPALDMLTQHAHTIFIPQKKNKTLPSTHFPPSVTAPTWPLPPQPNFKDLPGLPVSSSPPTHSSSHPNGGPFPEMALAEVINGFHDAGSKGLFQILFFILPHWIL